MTTNSRTFLVIVDPMAVRRNQTGVDDEPEPDAYEAIGGQWGLGESDEERYLTVPEHRADRAEELLEQDPSVREFIDCPEPVGGGRMEVRCRHEPQETP